MMYSPKFTKIVALYYVVFSVNRWLDIFINTRPFVKSVSQKYNFLISQPKHMLWVLKRKDGSFEHPKQILKLMGKKLFTILR